MSTTQAPTAIPDYGWKSGVAEDSHGYLQAPVLKIVAQISAEATRGNHSLRVFDAGCGNGALLVPLIERGYVVAGCDASDSGVQEANKQCAGRARVERLSVYENLSAHFGGDWDVVIATEVVEHLYDPRLFVRQASRLLRSGGTLVLTTPYHGYLKNLALAVTGKFDGHFTALWDGGHIKFWSYQTLTALLKEFGMTDFTFQGAGRVPGLWKSMIVTCRKTK